MRADEGSRGRFVAIIDGPVSRWPARILDPGAGATSPDDDKAHAAGPGENPATGRGWPPGALDGRSAAARHAQALADAMLEGRGGGGRELLNPVVFDEGLRSSVARVNAAFDALLAWPEPVDLVLCAFGLPRADDGMLARLDALSGRVGVIVASAPARGATVWPARHPGVLSVQGDARCGDGQWSWLGLEHATFGASPAGPAPGGPAGASLAAARFAGLLLAEMTRPHMPAAAAHMAARATFHGRERRR